ncbi:MAG: glutamate synthase-related protein [Oscillatoria sp. PMC 1068.18]|nr:glutamate synthase-related protein [Oscillatoria sp. PMC 1076.18]MEC4988363.1 glutamate synthase-related protein [Oscillatoria sp. PMC 1068.18]
MDNNILKGKANNLTTSSQLKNLDIPGPKWLVEERDACGVGLIASKHGVADHQLIEQSLSALGCLEHRGACSADRDTGDGSGIMTALPFAVFAAWFEEQGLTMPAPESLGVAMAFLPQDPTERAEKKQLIEQIVKGENLEVLGWREVPVRAELLGPQAREGQPFIEQLMVSAPDLSGDELDRRLYITRSLIGKNLTDDFYICSFSCRTIVYKGMVRAAVLGEFYLDLQNPDYKSAWAVYHRRFSTNTMPRWPLAQPMRMLGHNGEINTLLGNLNWAIARSGNLEVPGWSEADLEKLKPLVNPEHSDSFNLDCALELLVRTGMSPIEAVTILVPEAYKNQPALAENSPIIDFYEYHAALQEPWDGPALLVYGDGKVVGATLDRNGLRPARYCITNDGYLYVASEAGVVEIAEERVVEKGRLGPGGAIALDLERGEILQNWAIKTRLSERFPYREWIDSSRIFLGEERHPEQEAVEEDLNLGAIAPVEETEKALVAKQAAFGMSAEDVEMVIVPMALAGKEPTFCMGDDIPLAVLSDKPRLLYDYFKQRFAQVTNPPIDPLRESLVMDLRMFLGKKGNLLNREAPTQQTLVIESPLLSRSQLKQIEASPLQVAKLRTSWDLATGTDLKSAIAELCHQAEASVKAGAEIIILSDAPQLNENTSFLPPLLAIGAVHHHLIRACLRLNAGLVVETGQCWSTHHYAMLIGYGATAVCPYLAWETVETWWGEPRTQKLMERGKIESISLVQAQQRYRKSVEAGLLKILSKMGISLLSSYQGAQIFECIGLGSELIDLAFAGTVSQVGGLSWAELKRECLLFHQRGFPQVAAKLENYGFVNYRPGGEYHMNSPQMAKSLHAATRSGSYDHYQVYQQYLSDRPPTALRDLLDFRSDKEPIEIEEVEGVEEIAKRFCTGAMSLGSLSREAHETLAIAMNRLGGKSNSGEGGEDPIRFKVLEDVGQDGISPTLPHLQGLRNGDTASSATKQVASGRFGVTPEYLVQASQLEIKIAQGAKPGEGGQLPGQKVSPYIAMLRRSKPGVPLISPPPHHDIYSIEDLAQLIYDLHSVNPEALVSVKLVAEIGIGTIAAGVAKANADVIQISGHDGGTGASPLSSIKHAGSPWELGLSEVHRVLLANQLRERVLLRVDGGLKSGWDVVMAALMGAQEYGFGSVAMIAEGCIMARICHTNNCPVGVATQQERLRQRFPGTPDAVVRFMYFVAEEVRSLLAKLGYRSLEEIIGRSDLLVQGERSLSKTEGLDLGVLTGSPIGGREFLHSEGVHGNGAMLDDELLADAEIEECIASQGKVKRRVKIVNTDRATGARIAGELAARYGNEGFAGELNLEFVGVAGQSFGAFNLGGMNLSLVGEANDYVGKGMYGGEIVICPPPGGQYVASENAIVGNTCLYGATGGFLFACGRAGERFAVRNSAGVAVIEGAGDHTCEYMTGGVVVVLGSVGRNVGAGMTGGIGYFLDEDGSFPQKVNGEIVRLQRVTTSAGEKQLRELVEAHCQKTGSVKAQQVLGKWEEFLPLWWQVVPPSEAETPEASEGAMSASAEALATGR